MTSLTCPTHGQPWKLVPAGVSKTTGAPYTSFYACPERGCRQKPGEEPSSLPQSSPAPTATPALKVATAGSQGASQRLLLALGCMDFASRIFQQSENDIAARTCAHDAFEEWKDKV